VGFLDRLRGDGGQDDDDPAQARRAEDLARVQRGSIPIAAEERIAALAAGATGFTSGLSVADFALTRLESIRPVCQVMGTSVYKVGWQNYPWSSGWGQDALTSELRPLTDAWNDARRRALNRLAEEAAHARCHAVVDVTFVNRRHAFLSDEIEVVVLGTAVHLPEGPTGDAPVLTDLSLPDYVLLRRGGYAPVGVVASTSVFYVIPGRQTRSATTGWQFQANQELADFTQGVYEAREQALGRATEQARALGAGGLVGMSIDHHVATREIERLGRDRRDLIVTFHVLGTAIAPHGEHEPQGPKTILPLGARTA
jgi:uncharacterized protein YbjQ (UPF0145 family)